MGGRYEALTFGADGSGSLAVAMGATALPGVAQSVFAGGRPTMNGAIPTQGNSFGPKIVGPGKMLKMSTRGGVGKTAVVLRRLP